MYAIRSYYVRHLHPGRRHDFQPHLPRRERRSLGRESADRLAWWRSRLLAGGQLSGFLPGVFLDFFELAFIIVPLLAPVADKLGIDLICVITSYSIHYTKLYDRNIRA